MVGFGDHLHKEQTSDYDGQYLDYDMLKRKLKEVIEKKDEGAGEQVVTAMRTILQGLFDAQIEKVLQNGLIDLQNVAGMPAHLAAAIQSEGDVVML